MELWVSCDMHTKACSHVFANATYNLWVKKPRKIIDGLCAYYSGKARLGLCRGVSGIQAGECRQAIIKLVRSLT